MKIYGPKSWCQLIEERTISLKIPDDVTVLSLNVNSEFVRSVGLLKSETERGQRVIVYSTTGLKELKTSSDVERYLVESNFVQGPKKSVIDLLFKLFSDQ